MKANYHTHTKRCFHAGGEDREYVESAIRAGFDVLGFADHVPYPFPGGYTSHMRMPMAALEGYFRSISDLKKEYEKDIEILIGFEAEYMPALFDDLLKELGSYPLDYLLLGQHFPDSELAGGYVGYPFSDPAELSHYVNMTLQGLDTGRFLYLAHPDLPYFEGSDEAYRTEMERLCRETKKRGTVLEFNLLGYAEQRWYPRAAFWEIVKEVGNDVIIGYDAHQPSFLLRDDVRERAKGYLRGLGIVPVEAMAVRKR